VATVHTTWYGVVVEFSHAETVQIVAGINTGAASVGVLTAILTGAAAPAAAISAIVSALLGLGAATLGGCNSRSRGIRLHVLWVGLPWC